MKKSGLPWIALAGLLLLLVGLGAPWVWNWTRARQRDASENAAIRALHMLARLQESRRQRLGSYSAGDVALLLAESMPSPSVPMPPEWQEIYDADLRGTARPTSYGYLFEALPAKGFLLRAVPAGDPDLRTFAVDQTVLVEDTR